MHGHIIFIIIVIYFLLIDSLKIAGGGVPPGRVEGGDQSSVF